MKQLRLSLSRIECTILSCVPLDRRSHCTEPKQKGFLLATSKDDPESTTSNLRLMRKAVPSLMLCLTFSILGSSLNGTRVKKCPLSFNNALGRSLFAVQFQLQCQI